MAVAEVERPAGVAQPAAEPSRPAARYGVWDWLTTVDHKKIGILYIVTTFLFFLLGGLAALLVRLQLALPDNPPLSAGLYNQVFTVHASLMIFLYIIPILSGGFGNYLVPLMIGARDMAFPRLNALSYWLVPPAGLMILSGFFFGGAADAGWTAYPPLSVQSPYGQTLWLVGVIILGTSSILGGLNFLVTILNMRTAGMTLHRMPLFVWAVLVTAFLQVSATPALAGALLMQLLDREFGTNFFNALKGANVVGYQHGFWFYSHPAVYIMILPAFGIISEILPVFSRKPIFGYRAIAYSTAAIGFFGFLVWAHHMFTVGMPLIGQSFFMLMTMVIAIPTGVKMFNWIATLWGGQLDFKAPLLFAVGFLMMFLIGGLNGVATAVVPVDWQLHDTYWVVAHLHYVLFGGSTFGVFAGLYYWFPKMTGRMYSEGLAKVHFWLMFIGFNVTFLPMHILGAAGMQRRIATYPIETGFLPWNVIQTVGAVLMFFAISVFLLNVARSMRSGPRAGPDPWLGNSLEWYIASPPPVYNFRKIPRIASDRPLRDLRIQLASRDSHDHSAASTDSAVSTQHPAVSEQG
jgi:cytochrome c oxidase subunit 1